jgi:Leucine-rich repeat (LRR) protein
MKTLSFERGLSPKDSMHLGQEVQIKNWLNEMGISNYTIIEDLLIDVHDNVIISSKNLDRLPEFIKFNKVNGNFVCSNNKLTTLSGCPKVVKGSFDCGFNRLTSLEGAPQEVLRNFSCGKNKLKSLKGCPKKISGAFHCYQNELQNLEGAPEKVALFSCCGNQLTSLKGAPKNVLKNFYCNKNKLESFEDVSFEVKGDFICYDNPVRFTEEHVRKFIKIKGRIKLYNSRK